MGVSMTSMTWLGAEAPEPEAFTEHRDFTHEALTPPVSREAENGFRAANTKPGAQNAEAVASLARQEVRQRQAKRLLIGDRHAAECGRLRLRGLTFRQIAEETGMSLAGVFKAHSRFRRTVIAAGMLEEDEA